MVIVIVPKNPVFCNLSLAHLTGDGNDNPKVPSKTDEDVLLVTKFSHTTNAIGIVVSRFRTAQCIILQIPPHNVELKMQFWLGRMNFGRSKT